MQTNDALDKRIARLKARTSYALDARVHDAIDQAARRRNRTAGFPFTQWITFMRNPNTKWTAAAIAFAATIVGVLMLTKASPAFAVDQIIEASKKVRCLHVKRYDKEGKAPNEFWIKCDDSGQVAKARYFLPGTEDGDKLITWTPERAEVWFQSKHGYLLLRGGEIKGMMQKMINQCEPQKLMQELDKSEKAGDVTIDTQKPADPTQPVVVYVTSKDSGKDKWREVLRIDPETHLISSIERYAEREGKEAQISKMEFSDYNVPIDDKMFSLRGDLPADVHIADKLNQTIGVPQGSMTDEQIATDAVRQFFQALVDSDYKKAGLIYGGQAEDDMRKELHEMRPTSILSVGPAVVEKGWVKRGYRVPFEVETTKPDGSKESWKGRAFVRPGDDETHPDNWCISGGI